MTTRSMQKNETHASTQVVEAHARSAAVDAFVAQAMDRSSMVQVAGSRVIPIPGIAEKATLEWAKKSAPGAFVAGRALTQVDVALAGAKEWERILSSKLEGAELIDTARAEVEECRRLEDSAMQAIAARQRALEREWNHLSAFFQAGGDATEEVRARVEIVCADLRRLLDDSWAEFVEQFPPFDTWEHDKLVGLWLFTQAVTDPADLEKLGRIAERTRGLAICAYESCDWSTATARLDSGDQQDIKGPNEWQARLVQVGNDYSLRGPTDAERRAGIHDALWASPAPHLAGKILRGDEEECIGTPQVGAQRALRLKTRDGSPLVLRWSLVDKAEAVKLKKAVIPLIRRDGEYLFWGIESLLSSDQLVAQYQVMRVKSHIEKVLAHMLDGFAFDVQDEARLEELINAYLRSITGGKDDPTKMITKGLARVRGVPGTNGKEVNIDVNIGFKVATEKFFIRVEETTLPYTATEGGEHPVLTARNSNN